MLRCLTLTSLILLLFSATAEACRCRPPGPPKDEMAKSIGVFAGKVTAIKKDERHLLVTVAVSQSFKGQPAKEVTVRTANNGAACGYGFQVDQEYLIYCSGEKGGVWATNLCTRTRRLADAKEDLEAFGPGEMPK